MSDAQNDQSEIKLPEEPVDKKVVSPITIDAKRNTLVAKDNTELMRIINIFMQGQSFPKTMDTAAKCITAWNMACSLVPEAPQRAISRMMYINNQLGIWGELPKMLAERTKELTKFECFVVDMNHDPILLANKNLNSNPWAAVCRIQRKDRSLNEYFFTMDEAHHAGLLNKSGPWQTYPKAMLMWRAQGMALKFEFADALMGAEIIEHRFNALPEEGFIKDVQPADASADINKALDEGLI